ncbi:hypothetical protein ON010_g6523 [Phytophthora cinnamomi]|nr:hypothetical protein ON010_g6523 [Phytophthora cinnamomi]
MTGSYKPELVKLISYKDNVKYISDPVFTMEELLWITPDDLCCWMNEQAYGGPVPTEEMCPVHRRSSTLELSKTAISSFTPGVNSTWGTVMERGNPACSDAVNKTIKKVKKFKVRRDGAEPMPTARRSLISS